MHELLQHERFELVVHHATTDPAPMLDAAEAAGVPFLLWLPDNGCDHAFAADMVVVPSMNLVDKYRTRGIGSVFYCPPGCVSDWHLSAAPRALFRADVLTYGDPGPTGPGGEPVERLVYPLIKDSVQLSLWGRGSDSGGWLGIPGVAERKCHRGEYGYDDVPALNASGRIVLDITAQEERRLPPRNLPAILARGALCVTEPAPDLAPLFENHRSVCWSHDAAETAEIVAFYLSNEEERVKVATAGQRLVLNCLDYRRTIPPILIAALRSGAGRTEKTWAVLRDVRTSAREGRPSDALAAGGQAFKRVADDVSAELALVLAGCAAECGADGLAASLAGVAMNWVRKTRLTTGLPHNAFFGEWRRFQSQLVEQGLVARRERLQLLATALRLDTDPNAHFAAALAPQVMRQGLRRSRCDLSLRAFNAWTALHAQHDDSPQRELADCIETLAADFPEDSVPVSCAPDLVALVDELEQPSSHLAEPVPTVDEALDRRPRSQPKRPLWDRAVALWRTLWGEPYTLGVFGWLWRIGPPTLLTLITYVLVVVPYSRVRILFRKFFGLKPSIVWGPTPILNIAVNSQVDRGLGYPSETVVYTTYFITKAFDHDLSHLTKHPVWARVYPHLVFIWASLRYDIFHYYYDNGFWSWGRIIPQARRYELPLLRLAGKRIISSAYGSDVRVKKWTERLGAFNCCMHCDLVGKACTFCAEDDALTNLAYVRRWSTVMLSMMEMTEYTPGSRNDIYYWPIDLDRVPYIGVPEAANPVRIVHAPNHRNYKGTRYLLDVVDELRREGYALDLVLVERRPNNEARQLYEEADIIAEQFLIGSIGYFAVEAMAMGKPVICYIRKPEYMPGQGECPIVSAHPLQLKEALVRLLTDGKLRHDLGRQGRAYVEKYWSKEAVGGKLDALYREIW